MEKPKLPKNEDLRLAELLELSVLDTLPEESYDRITQLAAIICQTPIALVSLVDKERQWFKSKVGLAAAETSREVSFCGHAVLGKDLFVVENALEDKRFADNPLVVGNPDIRFYAGMPLVTQKGLAVGTLCVIDSKAKALSDEQRSSLRLLAQIVVDYLEVSRKAEASKAIFERMRNLDVDSAKSSKQVHQEAKILTLAKFVASVAHQINTPLAIIKANAQSISKEIEKNQIEPSVLKKKISSIGIATDRASNVIRSLLYITEGSGETTLSQGSLEYLFMPVKQKALEMLGEKGNLSFNYEPRETVLLNFSNFQNVVTYLLKNSIQACKNLDSLKISVTANVKEDSVSGENIFSVEVEDNGEGFNAEQVKDLFVPLVSSKEVGQGVGLSLCIAKRICEEHGGSIKLVSAKKPTKFLIEIPQKNAEFQKISA